MKKINDFGKPIRKLKRYDEPFIQQAVEILQKDPSQSYTITSLALEVGINSFKLREGFKQLYHQTIYQFRLGIRLDLAKKLLDETDLTIAEIAYKVGFDSRDSFARCFKKKFNLSPREWRNIHVPGAKGGDDALLTERQALSLN